MASNVFKRKLPKDSSKEETGPDELKLFVDAPPDGSDDGEAKESSDEEDSSVSEDSDFSGFDEEEESEVESIETGSSSGSEEEEDSEDGSGDEDDDGDGDDDDNEEGEENGINSDVQNENHIDNASNQVSTTSSKDEESTTSTKSTANKSPRTKNKLNNEKRNVQSEDTVQAVSRKAGRKLQRKKLAGSGSAEPSGGIGTSSAETSDGVSTVQGTSGPTINGPDEYDFDSSDEEDVRNTVGNIPMEWYREFEHIGYTVDGKKIIKPQGGDRLDEFINKMDNPDYWRTVTDKSTGQNVILSDKDVETIQRLRRGRYVDPNYNPYEPWVDFFTHDVMKHPVTNRPEHKRSFIPSKWERQKVSRMVHAIKMGWCKPKKEKTEEEQQQERFYMLWKTDDPAELSKRYQHHIPAPKMSLPGHAESYNPPPEYLLTEEEEMAWKEQDPDERRVNFVPRKYSSLRLVPAYPRFIHERFERCLDLYLCPRLRKTRMNVDPQDLIPKLPKPKDLQPFPTTQAIVYRGHTDIVRTVSCDPTGQWLASGSDDGTVRFWEVSTGYCMKTLSVGIVVKKVVWNPSTAFCLIAAVAGDTVWIINPQLGDKLILSNTDSIISGWEAPEQQNPSEKKLSVTWSDTEGLEFEEGCRLRISHPKPVSQVSWHGRGDYMTVVMPDGESQSVLIHQLSKRRTQNPFRKPKGLVQCILFHPTRPFLFIATQRYVRVYNLLKQELVKKLLTNAKWVSSMAIHPGGDNLIVGSYDCRLSWFDLDLSTKPYQTLRHHRKAVRATSFHSKYPLFASASDDGTVIVCHGMVYNDLLQNPLIVPVKVLRGHAQTKNLGVLDCTFHPTQPWVFSSGADSTVRLYT